MELGDTETTILSIVVVILLIALLVLRTKGGPRKQ